MNKRKKSKIGILILLVFFAYMVSVAIDQQSILNKAKNELEAYQLKIEEEKRLNEEILKQKEEVNSDEYIEKVAREKLGLVKSNEKVLVDVNK